MEESIILQAKMNSMMLLDQLDKYKEDCIVNFENDWSKFEKELYKYETKRKEFNNWALQK